MVCAPAFLPRQKKALRLEVKIRGHEATTDSRLLPGYCLILRGFFSKAGSTGQIHRPLQPDFQATGPDEQGISSRTG